MARNPLIRTPPRRRRTSFHKSAGILDDFAIRKNIATKEGTVEKVPVDDKDIANKAYVDSVSGGAHTESSTDTLTNKTITSFTNTTHADLVHINVRNSSGGTITAGSVVYISGYNIGLDLPEISKADSDSSSTMPALGMLQDDISNNASGMCIISGRVMNIDTSGQSVGDKIYVSGTAGAFTTTKPIGTALIQKIGIVLRSHATLGIVEMIGAGRTNDLKNIANTKIWIGDSDGVPQEFALSGDALMDAGGVVTIDHVNINSIGTNSHSQIDTSITATGVNSTHVAGDGSDHTNVATNTTHIGSDGSDHSIVVANQTHAADNTQAHSDYLLNSAADVGVGLTLTGDNTTADTAYVPQVLFGTDASPPAASGFTKGSVYIQYTA